MRITICFCVLGLCTGALGSSYEYKEFELCYGDIGCFSNAKPFDNANGLIPASPENIQIKFLLYTRANTQSPQIVSTTPRSIQMSHFSSTKKTIFIIHGMSGNGEDPWVTTMTQAILILKREDANVFVADWSKGAEVVFWNLVPPVANTRVVGALIAQFIKQLHTTAQAQYDNFHLIGHSLGAHVAGYAGEWIRLRARPGRLGRITGLDPAGFLFENTDPKVRLDPTDAVFVEALHTDIDPPGMGIRQSVGHVDYFPNGGGTQPDCGDGLFLFNNCSHMRVLDLFIESISSNCLFRSCPCSSRAAFQDGKCRTCGGAFANMGYSSTSLRRGTYYLPTNGKSPFCKD